MFVYWVGAGYQWRHIMCMLGVCLSAVATWVYAGRLLISDGDVGVCWVGVDQQRRRERVLGGC